MARARNVIVFMRRLVFKPVISSALGWAALLALVLCAAKPGAARADCFPVSDPTYATLDPMVDKHAQQALTTVTARLDALSHAGHAVGDARQLAALYAVQADAYSILELDHEARAAAAKGLALLDGPTDALRLELLST